MFGPMLVQCVIIGEMKSMSSMGWLLNVWTYHVLMSHDRLCYLLCWNIFFRVSQFAGAFLMVSLGMSCLLFL